MSSSSSISNRFTTLAWILCMLLIITCSNCHCGKLKAGRDKRHSNPLSKKVNSSASERDKQGDQLEFDESGDLVEQGDSAGLKDPRKANSRNKSPYEPNQEGRTGLHDVLAYAVNINDIDAIKIALANAPVLTITDKLGRNLIHEAVYGGNKEVVRFLLEKLQKQHPDKVQSMINQSEGSLGRTPLIYALRNRNIELAKLLINYGAKPTEEDMVDGLSFAVKDGQLPLLKYVVEEIIADQRLPIIRGENLLHVAAKFDFYDIIEYLTKHQQVNIQALNEEGRSALHYAALYDNKNSLIALIEKGLDINAPDKQGKTPLHLAAEKINRDAVFTLLGYHADFTLPDKQGQTVVDIVKSQVKADPSNINLKLIERKLRARIQ
jgi:ankyrin repeat protein